MSQTTATVGGQVRKSVTASNAAQAVLTGTTLIEVPTLGLEQLCVEVKPTVHDFTAFTIQVKFHPDGDFITLYNAAADFTSPHGLLQGASGDLTILAAAAIGWFILDVRGVYAVKVTATGASGTLCSTYAAAS